MSNFIDITDYDASIHREILDSLLRQGTADYDPQIVEICEDRAVMEMRSYLNKKYDCDKIFSARGTDRHRPASAPRRLTASGAVSIRQMRQLLAAGVLASLSFGIALLAVSSPSWSDLLLFLLLGALAILAAITYTVGRYAYGHHALGEVSVFCFFGLLGVIGSYYLQSGSYRPAVLLPATGCGLLSAAVLHVNNMRDIDSDAAVGKSTIAVKLGFARSKTFHLALLAAAVLCYFAYAVIAPASLLWLLACPALARHAQRIFRAADPVCAGRELKAIVLITCAINLLFSLGLCFVT